MPRTWGSFQGGGRCGRVTPEAASIVTMPPLPLPSADRDRVEQTALSPQMIEAALEFELGILAERAVEDLAVIADQFDLVVSPFLVEPQRLARTRSDAEHTFDVRIIALQ